jgi:hypothetical protein
MSENEMAIKTDCGSKHLSLACWLIGIFMSVALVLSGALFAQATALDTRLRAAEQASAKREAQFAAIQESLRKIEHALDVSPARANAGNTK